jgi:ribonucleoside-triphosphate reductase
MDRFITKRNGEQEEFCLQKIIKAVSDAFKSCGYPDIPSDILGKLKNTKTFGDTVEDIQDSVENILFDTHYKDVYNHFVTYRANHAVLREIKNKTLFDSIIGVEKNDVTRENGNMNSDTPAGMMMKFASETTKAFVDRYMLSKDVKDACDNNLIHIHDKDYYLTRSLTCLQHPLNKILKNGFQSGHGAARPAKRIETAAFIACISMETIQNEMHGGQSIPAFDFYMAPYVRATFKEEINKIKDTTGQRYTVDWKYLMDWQIDDYIPKDTTDMIGSEKIVQLAINNTVKRVHQAMESFVHNMNTIHSRGGNQVVFSSINYGTDTSAEGRCVIRELLKTTDDGVGNNSTAIFPIQIWKMKSGVSVDPGDPNYDLYQYSLKVAARRFFPNYLNLDATFNQHDKWDKNDPNRFEYEVATMGCRTRVFENRFGEKTTIGRGNLSFTTINLPKLAIEISIEDGYLVKEGDQYVFNMDKNTKDDQYRRLIKFLNKCVDVEHLVAKQLDERYQFQKNALAKQFPLLMKGMWNGSEKLELEDTIESVINQGTLGIGFIGLAEALVALTGKHHAEDPDMQEFGLSLIDCMKQNANILSEQYQHNYSILATPAEGLSGKFTARDKKNYGDIPGVTDREYYTNSSHVPVYYKCPASHKAKIECPYHELELGGHIFYVEADYDPTKNPEAIDVINKIARDNNGGYISFNHNQGRCNQCGFESHDPNLVMGDECPHCKSQGSWDQLSRVTGYLISTTDRWNKGKLAELQDRVTHI